jgi:outer membrane lipoprotein SlyB
MAEMSGSRLHPLIIVAATAVILTCLVAIGAMTGVIPMKRTTTTDVVTAPGAPAPQVQSSALQPTSPAPTAAQRTAQARTAPPATGTTAAAAGAGALAGSGPAHTAAPPPCANCGTVTAVRAVTQQGEASPIGPAAGALLGGILGHQIGHGTGQTIATAVGAGVGAAGGVEVERRMKSTTSYVIDVRMEDGSVRHFSSPTQSVSPGAKVKVIDGKLHLA